MSSPQIRLEALTPDPVRVASLTECVRACYGETYAEGIFYDVSSLCAALDSGLLVSQVALCEERVVGHLGTRFAVPGDVVAETIGGLVVPEFRGQGLLRRLGGAMNAMYRERRLAGVRLLATTAHTRTQQMIAGANAHPTGMLLAHIPAETRYREIAQEPAADRIASVVYLQSMGTLPPLEIFVPPDYAERIGAMAAGTGAVRQIVHRASDGAEVAGEVVVDSRRGAAVIRIGSLTASPRQSLSGLLASPSLRDFELVYCDIPLCDPCAPAAIAAARSGGFVFGAYLPGSRSSEALRLQSVASYDEAQPQIAEPSVRALHDEILRELRGLEAR